MIPGVLSRILEEGELSPGSLLTVLDVWVVADLSALHSTEAVEPENGVLLILGTPRVGVVKLGDVT